MQDKREDAKRPQDAAAAGKPASDRTGEESRRGAVAASAGSGPARREPHHAAHHDDPYNGRARGAGEHDDQDDDGEPAASAPAELARQVDRFVAECIRHRRRELGMNQREFGQRVGVSLQQVHKYERQLNRVSAGRLFVIARVLKVPIQYFFAAASEAAPQGEVAADPAQAQLLHQCGMLRDPAHQRAVASLCRLLMDAERQSNKR